jgi:hypothetical protein
MKELMKSGWRVGLLAVVALLVMTFNVQAAIIFAPLDYDNTANTVTSGPTTNYNQTTGLFRDVIWWSINDGKPRVGSGDYINRGNSLYLPPNTISAVPRPVGDPLAYSALNLTGPAISGGQSYLSIYDTTPWDGTTTKNTFNASVTGGITVSADVLFVKHNASGGVVMLYNEGQDALALLANNGSGNNQDKPKLSLVWQSVGPGITLRSITLPANSFVPENWYRLTMGLTVTGDTWTMIGTFQDHLTGSDPTSGLGSVITTLSYAGSLSDPDVPTRVLTNPGEIGIMAMGNESISLPDNVGVSVTNFQPVPIPAAFWLLGSGLVGLVGIRRRFKK